MTDTERFLADTMRNFVTFEQQVMQPVLPADPYSDKELTWLLGYLLTVLREALSAPHLPRDGESGFLTEMLRLSALQEASASVDEHGVSRHAAQDALLLAELTRHTHKTRPAIIASRLTHIALGLDYMAPGVTGPLCSQKRYRRLLFSRQLLRFWNKVTVESTPWDQRTGELVAKKLRFDMLQAFHGQSSERSLIHAIQHVRSVLFQHEFSLNAPRTDIQFVLHERRHAFVLVHVLTGALLTRIGIGGS